jgi:succinoglycan biosynthesis protein ExoA
MHDKVSNELPPAERPLVSVVLATYNEATSIERCLESILNQRTTSQETGPIDIEVIAVDGMSDDGTVSILLRYAARDPRLRMVNNEKRRAPFAFNLGLQHARGGYICIFGAHTVYRQDYIVTCLGELVAHGAAGCGGRVVTVSQNRSLESRLSAWVMSDPFGSSRKSFRTQREGPVDTVNYPIFPRHLVLAVGGYDEKLSRNQDNDLNQKLRTLGHTLWCTWKTECQYSPKGTLKGLLRYAFGNGFWNSLTFRINPGAMAVRHFIPFGFVLCLLAFGLLAAAAVFVPAHYALVMAMPLALCLTLHVLFGSLAALDVSRRERSLGAWWLPAVFLAFHIAYGLGTLGGFAGQLWAAFLRKASPTDSGYTKGKDAAIS